MVDRTTNTADVIKTGDVVKIVSLPNGQSTTQDGQDGVLTIEDLIAVSTLYNSIQSPIPPGLERRDINRDGFITIEDLSLAGYNYTSLVVNEDQ